EVARKLRCGAASFVNSTDGSGSDFLFLEAEIRIVIHFDLSLSILPSRIFRE
ncbi:hypothetical protein SDJN02_11624, partial [Cucurbita argyrosperma subsp. argyrosperma]